MRRVVVVAMAVAALVAGAMLALALYGRVVSAGSSASPSLPTGTATNASAPVSAEDYCYVEAMIFYRVSESQAAKVLLSKERIGTDMHAFAAAKAAQADSELTDLRTWYVSWLDARPAVPPVDGPCAGHGAEHAQMPGIPSPSRRQELVDAQGAAAEQLFAEILRTQNAGMLSLIQAVLEDAPNPRVRSSAIEARDHAAADDDVLQRLQPE